MNLNEVLDSSAAPKNDQLAIGPETRNTLRETAKWSKFIAIIGFIFLGLCIPGFVLFLGLEFSAGMIPTGSFGLFMLLWMLTFITIWFLVMLFLFRFGTNIQRAIQSNNNHYLGTALKNLKFYFRIIGVLSVLFIAANILTIVASLVMNLE